MTGSVVLASPIDGRPLRLVSPELLESDDRNEHYECHRGIWDLVRPARRAWADELSARYAEVRRREGRGSDDPAWYRALPYEDRTGRFADQWRVRACTFDTIVAGVVDPLARAAGRPLVVADVGAGNCWCAARLAERGHVAVALDVCDDDLDGLGAHDLHGVDMTVARAELDRLPLAARSVDLVLFNASFHYAPDQGVALREASRVLAPGGAVVIADSPTFADERAGAAMVAESRAALTRDLGVEPVELEGPGYLTRAEVGRLAAVAGLVLEGSEPGFGWRWTARRAWGRVRARRETARFVLFVGRQSERGER